MAPTRATSARAPAVDEANAPREAMRAFNVRQVELVSIWFGVSNLAFWPLDLPLLGDRPHELRAFAIGRVFIFALLLALRVGVARLEVAQRYVELVAAVASGLLAFVVAAMFAGLGGFERPWFYFGYIAPFVPTLHWLTLRTRIVATVSITAAFAAGYLWGHLDYLRSPDAGLACGYMVFAIALGILSGQESDRLRSREQQHQQRLAQQAAGLELRVDAQTQELRALALHLDAAQETERARIARELHDELGQELTAMRYALKMAKLASASTATPGKASEELENLAQLVDRISDTLRHILSDLRPRVLDDFGLDAAVEWLAQRASDRTGIPCVVAASGFEHPVPNDVAWAVFRIVQESLTNAMKHASASRVDLTLERAGGSLTVEVRDDGVGIPGELASLARRGMGLLGMRERARALRGELTIGAGASGGTRVWLRVPLPSDPET